jgi:O-Antigen ligase
MAQAQAFAGRQVLMTAQVKEPESLEMTDYFFLFGLFLLLWWAIDPLMLQLDAIPGVKRFPSLILGMNLAFIVVGRALFSNHRKTTPFVSIVLENRWLMLFSAFVVLGSLYAKFKNGIDETFLTMGLYVWVAPIVHWYTINSRAPWKLLRAILSMYVLVALVALCIQFYFFRKIEIFHNREHLVIPIIGVVLYYLPGRWPKLLAVLMVALATVAVSKITAFIVAVIALTYLLGLSLYRRLDRQKDTLARFVSISGFVVAVGFVIACCVAAYYTLDVRMPSGNTVYRLHTYEMAWDKFVHSPIWGHAFTKSAVVKFDLYVVYSATQNLPTHSDPLDILAGGGLIAFGLWVTALFTKIKVALLEVGVAVRPVDWRHELVHQAFLMAALTATIVCAFNPIYNIPNLASANWLAFGCMLTTTVLAKRQMAAKSSGQEPSPRKAVKG